MRIPGTLRFQGPITTKGPVKPGLPNRFSQLEEKV